MSQITPQHPSGDPGDLLHRNVQKTVAISTLRKIRTLVDEYDHEQRSNRRVSRWVAGLAALALIASLITLSLTGVALFRLLTGALVWFQSTGTTHTPPRISEARSESGLALPPPPGQRAGAEQATRT